MMPAGHVLIAGGTRGLGRVVAERFRSCGFAVSVLSRRKPVPAEFPPEINHIAADLETLEHAGEVVSSALELAGPIRYLVFCQRFRGQGDPWRGELQVSLTATRLIIEGFGEHFCPDGDRPLRW